jgi:3-oxoacid CoA-transferase subunit A
VLLIIAEVEELVKLERWTQSNSYPGIFVQRIFQGSKYEKRIEQRTVRNR